MVLGLLIRGVGSTGTVEVDAGNVISPPASAGNELPLTVMIEAIEANREDTSGGGFCWGVDPAGAGND